MSNFRLQRSENPPAPSTAAVFLVGFMGAGKSTVGSLLARLIGCNFIDLDDRIVERAGCSIAEIFAQKGEAVFRRLETETLRGVIAELRRDGPAVVALGGGAYVQDANRTMIAESSVPVVFLDAPGDELRVRCAASGATRPLFQDERRFRELYNMRRQHYARADFRVDTSGKTVDAVAEQILQLLAASKRTGE